MSTRDSHFARLVIERDGKCQVCGSTKDLQAHHIIPISEGGPDTPENGEALCPDCHADKHPDVPRGLIIERANGKAAEARWNATSLAAELGCCVRTVTRMAERAGIERQGGTWAFSEEDKDTMIACKSSNSKRILGKENYTMKFWESSRDKEIIDAILVANPALRGNRSAAIRIALEEWLQTYTT